MTTALLDSNAVSDMMRNHPILKARVHRHAGPVITTTTVVGEIRFGIERLPLGTKRSELEDRALMTLSSLKIRNITLPVSHAYGRLKAESKSFGWNLEENDLWIASAARCFGALLVSRDKDFSVIPGLVVEDWTV
jgi:predicted nucleic acid-binding protein